MKPGHVRNLEDYWVWLEKLIIQFGGWLQRPPLVVRPREPQPAARPHEWQGLHIDGQPIDFGNGSTLWISFVVEDDFSLADYSFHYQDQRGRLIWRKCNHPGHKKEGNRSHIHRPQGYGERVEPYEEVDLEDALNQVSVYVGQTYPGW